MTTGFDETFSGKPQNYVNLSGLYTGTVCAKLISGTGNVSMSWGRFAGTDCSTSFTPTSTWTAFTCTPGSSVVDTATVSGGFFTLSIPAGMVVELDSISLKEPASANPTLYRDALVSTLQTTGVGSIRELDNPFANEMANMLEPSTLTVTPISFSEGDSTWPNAGGQTLSIPMLLNLGLTVPANVWQVLPTATTQADATLLQDFLGTACSGTAPNFVGSPAGALKPDASRRAGYTVDHGLCRSAGLTIAFPKSPE